MSKKFENWEVKGEIFLRSVEKDFSLEEFREAMGQMGIGAPNDSIVAQWLRDRGWERYRKRQGANTRWKK